MKTALSIVLAALALSGCVAVPVPVAPRPAYVEPYPPPVVVIRPAPYYGYHGYGPGWRRWR